MEFLGEYGMFLAKTATVVAALLVLVGGGIALIARSSHHPEPQGYWVVVRCLNEHYTQMALALQSAMLSKKALKQVLKEQKTRKKHRAQTERRRVFVLNFQGDLWATAVADLREEVTAVLTVARPGDEVIVRLESRGGLVHGYGLAAAQLQRLKNRSLRLTVAVDKVAASGGYLMACVADRIVAAPFAVLGSIGVVAQLPNFHRFLKKHDVDFDQFMAGEYKRTVSLFGENTEKGRKKFQEEIEDTYALFKDFVKSHRPQLDLEQVATGECWFGTRALAYRLVDELRTSDEVLLEASADADLYEVVYTRKKPWLARLAVQARKALEWGD